MNHWKSTEFWTTIIAQVLAFSGLFGFVTPNDSKTLEEASNKIVAAIFLFVSNAAIIIYYIRSRLHMHLSAQEPAAQARDLPTAPLVNKLPLVAPPPS